MTRSTRRSVLLSAVSFLLLIIPTLLSAQEPKLFKGDNGLYGFKDSSGQVVIPAKYEYAFAFSEGLASVKINGNWGFINKDDNLVIPAKYKDAMTFSEGLAPVKINDKWGFIDKNDNLVIPAKYDDAMSFSEGLVRVKINVKWGFIDKNDNLVIPAKYDWTWSFSKGLAKVKINYKLIYIDRYGNEYNSEAEGLAAINKGTARPSNPAQNPEPIAQNGGGSTPATKPQAEKKPEVPQPVVQQPVVAQEDVDVNIPQGSRTAENTFAVIIANGKYDEASTVANAANDGATMEKYLTRTLGLPKENVLTYTDATFGKFKTAMRDIKRIADAYAGTQFDVIFYYVGHGLPDAKSREGYLLPTDIDPRVVEDCYPLSTLYNELADLNAANVTVMIDACFSGTNYGESGRGMLVADARGAVMKVKDASPKGNMVVLTASSSGQSAFPYKEKSHGMFTYFILKKLQETAGDVTLGELSDYVKTKVSQTSISVNSKPQLPTVAFSPEIRDSWRALPLGR